MLIYPSDNVPAPTLHSTALLPLSPSIQGLNAKPFFDFKDAKEFKQWVAMVPTSAHTGEGIPDLMMLLVQLTQNLMASRIAFVDKVCCVYSAL